MSRRDSSTSPPNQYRDYDSFYNSATSEDRPSWRGQSRRSSSFAGSTRSYMSAASISSLRTERDSLFEQLQEAKETIQQLREEIIETTDQLALKCEEQGSFDEAIAHVDSVIQHIKDLKVVGDGDDGPTNDEPSAEDLAKHQLEYEFRKGKLHFQQHHYEEAEHDIQLVLKRRQALFKDHTLQQDVTRETQLLLCEILRAQESNVKRREAELLYSQHNLLTQLTIQPQRDRDWRVCNAFHFACVQAEMDNFPLALMRMREVWSEFLQVSAGCALKLEDELVKLVNLLCQKGQMGCADSILDMVCRDQYLLTSTTLINLVIERGERLHHRGRHAPSSIFLFKVWTCPETPKEQKIRIGENLAIAMCIERQYIAARSVLRSLRTLHDSEEENLDILRIRALLAYIHLNTGNLSEAVVDATFVHQQEGIKNILQYPILHHCNTLITALSQQALPELFIEARQVWEEIYDRYSSQNRIVPVPPPGPGGRGGGITGAAARRPSRRQAPLTNKEMDDLREHIRVGRQLGESWTASARSREKRPVSGERIQNQANELEDVLLAA